MAIKGLDMKKIAVGDLGEFWYGDYKEPFEQLEGGVPGHPIGVILKDDTGRLLCAFCGRTYENLGNHARQKHGLPAATYKEEVGLLQGSALVSERLRVKSLHDARRRNLGSSPERMLEIRTLRGHARSYSLRTPERLNKTGRCYSQILEVGRSILRAGGRINRSSLRRHGIGTHPVLAYFSSLDEYRDAVGAPRVGRRPWSDQQLLDGLLTLANKIGRTPSQSDLRRYGLPHWKTFYHHFGSYSEACRRVGLDPNLPVPDGRNLDIAALVAYATTGSARRAARLVPMNATRIEHLFHRLGAPFVIYGHGGVNSKARREWAGEMAKRLASA